MIVLQMHSGESYYAIITAFYHVYLDHFNMNTHRHASYEIMYVSNGHCSITVEGKTLLLREKQGILISSNIPHKLNVSPEKPGSIMNLEFQISSTGLNGSIPISSIMDRYPTAKDFFSAPSPYHLFYDSNEFYYSFKDLIDELPKHEDPYLISLLMQRMLIVLCTRASFRKMNSGIHYITKAKDYIKEHYHEAIDASAIACHVGINKAYLQRMFRKYEDISVLQYINLIRMEKAVFLLINSDIPITDIAFQVGFNSRQHFGYTFQSVYGINPLKVRQIKGLPIENADTKSFASLRHVLVSEPHYADSSE